MDEFEVISGDLFDLEPFTEPAKERKRLDNLALMELRNLERPLPWRQPRARPMKVVS